MSQSDVDEEEEICRYCLLHRDRFEHLPMITCSCKNGVHPICLLKWIISRNNNSTKCEVCKDVCNIMTIYVLIKALPTFKKNFNMIGIIENGSLQYRLIEAIVNREQLVEREETDTQTQSIEEETTEELIQENSNEIIDEQVQEIIRQNNAWSIFIDNDTLNDEEIDSFRLLIVNNILHTFNRIRYHFGSYNTIMRIGAIHVVRLIMFWYMCLSIVKDLPEIMKLLGIISLLMYVNNMSTNMNRTRRQHQRTRSL